ncbi:nucleotidyl transferase AbiEii/AbiGii toxin family protein [Candidatus Woesearchaeota archaeon]|nr:nucleotidyl transferase AbiEii/AbiGii toxin family protein [Candidatus Woesearchaeota archaeon]
MIPKDFIDNIGEKLGNIRKELLEKDLLLHLLLTELMRDDYFKKNYVFKGGTCLTKCYLGYYRFSEDLDFSFIAQDLFEKKTEKNIRKLLSKEIDILTTLLDDKCKKLSFDYNIDKKNNKYHEFGGSNKFVTFKLWYISVELQREMFIKIQINFVEVFKYPFKSKNAISLLHLLSEKNKKELLFLFPQEMSSFNTTIKVLCYDLHEILLEKARAILTRQAVKERDFVDLYFILRFLGEKINNYKVNIIEKTMFMLNYEKYRNNLLENEHVLKAFKDFQENILLQQEPQDLKLFFHTLKEYLIRVIQEIKTKENTKK